MYRSQKLIALACFLVVILACNLPSGTQHPFVSVNDQAATIIAATLQAQAQNGGVVPISATFSFTPRSLESSTNSPTPSPVASPTITPTYSTPTLTVLQQTNCREGPGQDYEVTFTYLPKAKLTILGRYGNEDYWLVKSPESPTGHCWLWGEFVEVSGSYWVVPSVTPPPTATPPLPSAPSALLWNYECTFNGINNDLNVSLTWTDKANNETGYRVFRDGELIADLAAGSTNYSDRVAVNPGQSTVYRIEAYNITGGAGKSTDSISCS